MGIMFLEKLMHGNLVYCFLKVSFSVFAHQYNLSSSNSQTNLSGKIPPKLAPKLLLTSFRRLDNLLARYATSDLRIPRFRWFAEGNDEASVWLQYPWQISPLLLFSRTSLKP
jgi:hypothetical protein